MDISFIIPVYNTEQKILDRCFEAIRKITDFSFECLIIDDGSREEIALFCKEYANMNKMFRYIRKENGGVSSARNLGISEAKGKFVYFTDSDDELCLQGFKKSYFMDEMDLIFTDLLIIDKEKQKLFKSFDKSEGKILKVDVLYRMTKDSTLNVPFCKLIKNEFIKENNILFREDMVEGEDMVFLLDILEKEPQMHYFNSISYYYTMKEETGMNRLFKYPATIMENHSIMYNKMLKLINESQTGELEKDELTIRYTQCFIKYIFNVSGDLSNNRKLIDNLKEKVVKALNGVESKNLKKCSIKAKIQYYIIIKQKWFLLFVCSKLRQLYIYLK